MILQERIQIISELGRYMAGNDPEWLAERERAGRENTWFIPRFVDAAIAAIVKDMLVPELLEKWTSHYRLPADNPYPRRVGIVMAGNIPLVGFYDLLCVFISGNRALIKPSTKDQRLILHLLQQLERIDARIADFITVAERLQGCDAYIATGSNQTGRYFDQYFGKYPHIIRRNRTSVAILTGKESRQELEALAADMQDYFGLGCRNVTQVFVPTGYDFKPLLEALKTYDFVMDLPAYKHNFDYHLTLLIMRNQFYMTNDSVVLTENVSPFSPVSQIHYQFYEPGTPPLPSLQQDENIQCIVGEGGLAAGSAQRPSLFDYADGVDTLAFLIGLTQR
ncbi:MAG: acyl-CoA reductase [Sediminibacterium sp.]